MALSKELLRQRRWVKQRIAYLESDSARIVKLLSDRVSELESLLLWRPVPDVQHEPIAKADPVSTAPERSEGRLPEILVECVGCLKRYHFRGWAVDELEAYHRSYCIASGVE